MNLKSQRRMAAQILGIGENRIKMNPERVEDIADSITRSSVRAAIGYGAIQIKQKKGISRGRTRERSAQKKGGRRRGPGSRKGGKNARTPTKRGWIQKIRPMRAKLRELREAKKIDAHMYRKLYLWAKGGMYKNVPHMMTQMRTQGFIKEGD
ncbi:MAG: 50S ribosomal protein L19e [Methanobacteriota archaeon]